MDFLKESHPEISRYFFSTRFGKNTLTDRKIQNRIGKIVEGYSCITGSSELTASGRQCVRTAVENKVESKVQFDSVERKLYRKEGTSRQFSGNKKITIICLSFRKKYLPLPRFIGNDISPKPQTLRGLTLIMST